MGTINIIGSSAPLQVSKIICVGRNYREHAAEMKAEVPVDPVLFLKPPTAIVHTGENIILPPFSKEMHHEVELVVAVGEKAKNISASDAGKIVAGYGVGLDMTLRDVQNVAKQKGLPWAVAKGFDTSAPVSEFISAAKAGPRPVFEIECSVNGAIRQRASTSAMIFDVACLLHYISTIFTLEEGDLVFTGTPEGVGAVRPGDIIEAKLSGFTATRHMVIAA
ncbi:MAG TPA: fumarylacetoacetate hydrolase family protein [Bacteroidota bacterium]|nr:fumarylacetoacetate hydrolase family protein [Bacteroidota bacterium]